MKKIFSFLSTKQIEIEDLRITNFVEILEHLTDEFKRVRYISVGLEKIISKSQPDLDTIVTLAILVENDKIKEEFFYTFGFQS